MGYPGMNTAQLLRACQHQAWLKACSNPVGKALWFIESLLTADVSLDDLARIGGVSRHHMVRAFGCATGQSIVHYVRGRRLTEAARLLANGPPDVSAVALEYGYASHEAFSRAFFDQFGIAPETVRAQRHLDHLELVEPVRIDDTIAVTLSPPRLQVRGPTLIAGLGQRYCPQTSGAMPVLWQRLRALLGRIPGQVGRAIYGVRCNDDTAGNLDYVCGVEVADLSSLPSDLHRLRIPEQRYLVFAHRGSARDASRTWHAIWNHWLPQSGHTALPAPDFEHAEPGRADMEIWVPVAK